jgi:ERCC4-type nuclease
VKIEYEEMMMMMCRNQLLMADYLLSKHYLEEVPFIERKSIELFQ